MKISKEDQALLDSCCCLCLEETVLTTGEYRWCEEHRFKGELLAWGMAHEYPALAMKPYAVGQGAYCWTIAAIQGSDEMVYLLLAAIEMEEAS